jgi:1-acyl-sn-glycerol-3-phosphate acyltransferase
MFAMKRVKAAFRGAISVVLFALYGIGGLAISPIMLVLRRPELCQSVVRAVWIPLVWLFEVTSLIKVERGNLGSLRGCVIVANHPSLIDVVLVSVLVPRTLFVAKHALLKNPFMAAIVRNTSLPDDERLPEAAAPYLAKGWNVLVFPEGTRSPSPGVLRDFHRGAAQLALRTGACAVCVGIRLSRAILGKRQNPWDMGDERVVYSFSATAPFKVEADATRGFRPQAAEITEKFHTLVAQKMV